MVITTVFLQMAVKCPEEGVPLSNWLTVGLHRAPSLSQVSHFSRLPSGPKNLQYPELQG